MVCFNPSFFFEFTMGTGSWLFLRYLLDGDLASNTLGKRWVACLHKRGGPYQAQFWNIAKFTNLRFELRWGDLSNIVEGLEAQEPDRLPAVQPLRTPNLPKPNIPSLLVISADDYCPENLNLERYNIIGSAVLASSHLRSFQPVSLSMQGFEAGALQDTAERQR